jgi:hypothetical protein
LERLGCGINGVKDYNHKQSILIVAAGCILLGALLYFTIPFLTSGGIDKVSLTRAEEKELAGAIANYAIVFHGYPVGENATVTKALMGTNPQQLKFLNVGGDAIKDGQFVDRWDTPYKVNFSSTNSFIIISAGENRSFGDTDDVIFDSTNLPTKP